MGFRFLSLAVMVTVAGAAAVQAQSISRIGGPANPPPAGFQGEQFVDSRGCVFLRAGYGGQVTWVPRVGRDRKALCGYPPTGSTQGAIEVATAEEMARPAAPVVVEAAAPKVKPAAPAPAAATKPVAPAPVMVAAPRQPAPYVEAAPAGGYEVAAAAGPAKGKIGCYTSAPVAERVRLSTGGTAVVCTRGDGTMMGWRPPIYPRDAGVGAALSDPGVVARAALAPASPGGTVYASGEDDAIPAPPAGYELAWDDDRLNPNRGKGTAAGWAAQDQIWTRKVPATLVADRPGALRKKKVVYVQPQTVVTVSTKGQPAAPKLAAKGGAYVQVGTFGLASNADGAAARLKGLGLPVARAKISSGGQPMQIVLAGPFGSAADAGAALALARQAGFGDAFLR